MQFRLYGENRAKAVGLMCVCMIWLVTACSSNPGQLVNSTAQQTHIQGSPQSNSTSGSYQDNRAEYILNNVASFATAGIIAVLFGPGNGGTMNIDAAHDGVTNAGPISTYECNMCNNQMSSYPDDDGGYLRIFVGQYLQHPVALS